VATNKSQAPAATPDDVREAEYEFDFSKAQPNRFAGRIDKSRVVVLLDADVSKVFTSEESVNNVLRALITTMPQVAKKQRMSQSS
jgi:hypothetical protein